MEAVTTMLSNAVTVFGSCWDAMTSNVPIAILVGLFSAQVQDFSPSSDTLYKQNHLHKRSNSNCSA